MRKALLTVDDSPSPETDLLTEWLADHDIPAILFCRGDRLADHPDPVTRAIEKGFVIGNHAWSHRRASTLPYDEIVDEIERTEELIDRAYREAGRPRSVKYFRFPHMDRGCGGWVVDYDAAPAHRSVLVELFSGGLNIDLTPPAAEQWDKKRRLQEYLKTEGFSPLPSGGVAHPWFVETEMAQAIDAMFTFSTSDWMVTPRHAGQWPYKTADDLLRKIDDDPWLARDDSAHIILMHDQEGLFGVTTALLRYCLDRGISFSDAA